MIQTILQLIYRTKQGKEDNSFGGQNNFIKKYFTKGIAAFVIFFDMLYKSAIAIGITFYEIFATKGETLERKNLFSVLQNLLIRIVIHVRGKILWDTFRFSALDCRKTQLAVLESILAENKETVYGREYGFEYINSSGDFQKRVPVNSYEDLSPYLDRMCNGEEDVLVKGKPVIYATTSGTTGKPKFIPVTSSTLKEGHKLIKDIWIYHLGKSKKRFITGKVLAVVSPSTEGHTPDGTPFGSTSGHIYKNIKKIVQNKYVIPSFVMDIEDYNTKYYVILLLALRESRITYISTANPSTILLLCRKMNEWINDLISDIAIGSLKPGLSLSGEERQKVEALLKPHHKRAKRLRHFHTKHGTLRPKEIWPHLAALGCWTGGNAGTFLSEIKPYFNPETEIRELGYLASEMRGSLPISPGSSEGILTINENFFEFVEIEEWNSNEKAGSTRFKMAHEVETGKEYYIFITNNSGLYRYNMNDIVRVTGKYLSTPLITFLQKGKGVTNITGEKLYENQFTSAVEKAKKKLKLPLHFYMGIANTEKCYYEVVAEFNGTTDDSVEKEFIDLVDQYLGKINCEYEAKRKSLRLNKASLEKLPSGSYEKFKTRRVQNGQREGQFKIVSLTSDQAIKNELWDRV